MARLSIASWMMALILSIGTTDGTIWAQDLSDDLHINGFVSQGYLNTTKNDYLVPRSTNGTAEFTEAAITFSANPMDRLRIGVQFMARNFGSAGHGQVQLDWAFGDYRFKDELGFRAGRVKLPFGFYNEGRDVDMLRTSVFLPQSVYNEKMRDLLLAYEGIGAYGSLNLGQGGELDYHAYGGTLNVSDATKGIWDDTTRATAQVAALILGLAIDQENGWVPGTTEVGYRNATNSEVTFPWVWGGSLVWKTPLEGLRLGASFMNGRFHYQGDLHFDVVEPEPDSARYSLTASVDETTNIDYVTVASAEYTHGNLIFVAEYSGEKIGPDKSNGWYGLGGYRVSDLFSLAGYYSVSYGRSNDKSGEAYQSLGLPDYYAWLKDFTVSTRFDLTSFWLLKFEYHFLNGVEQTNSPPIVEAFNEPLAKNWGMLTAKTTFAF